MCGICGIILKDHNQNYSKGALLYQMMEGQQIRAQDSAGIAIFNDKNTSSNDLSCNLTYLLESPTGYELREEKGLLNEQDRLALRLIKNDRVSVIGCSKEMMLVKDLGLVKDLDNKYKIKSMQGSHGIGHLRIATSSKVDLRNAHPFSTTVMPDIAVVHNGEITNYPKLKKALEIQGYPFYSNCDSEVIAVFLADQLLKHGDIERAHNEFIQKADGPFTYIAATNHSLSLIRDRFGTRKGIVGYNPGGDGNPAFWAMATDLSALDIVGANEDVKAAPPGKSIIFTV
jgi:glutamine phosphoribosylpyrophosphate amidotransferase